MKHFYLYPFVMKWDSIIPIDYPFITIQGPGESIGVMLVFDSMDKYMAYCGDDYIAPLTVGKEENGKQQN